MREFLPRSRLAPALAAALIVGSALLAASPASAALCTAGSEKRAVVIGNDLYGGELQALDNAAADAKLVAEALVTHGYDVALGTNLSRADMESILSSLALACSAKQIIFYFAGQGLVVGDRVYALPGGTAWSKADFASEATVAAKALALDAMLKATAERFPERQVVAIFDATATPAPGAAPAREDTFGRARLGAEVVKRLAENPQVALVAFSGEVGGVVLDAASPGDPNGPFAGAFAKALSDPAVESFDKLLLDVADEVGARTGGRQTVVWYRSPGLTAFPLAQRGRIIEFNPTSR